MTHFLHVEDAPAAGSKWIFSPEKGFPDMHVTVESCDAKFVVGVLDTPKDARVFISRAEWKGRATPVESYSARDFDASKVVVDNPSRSFMADKLVGAVGIDEIAEHAAGDPLMSRGEPKADVAKPEPEFASVEIVYPPKPEPWRTCDPDMMRKALVGLAAQYRPEISEHEGTSLMGHVFKLIQKNGAVAALLEAALQNSFAEGVNTAIDNAAMKAYDMGRADIRWEINHIVKPPRGPEEPRPQTPEDAETIAEKVLARIEHMSQPEALKAAATAERARILALLRSLGDNVFPVRDVIHKIERTAANPTEAPSASTRTYEDGRVDERGEILADVHAAPVGRDGMIHLSAVIYIVERRGV